MGNALAMQPSQIIIEEDDPLLRDYKKASVKDYHAVKENFDALQVTVGDKMTVTLEEFDEIFSLICQDASEHFELFDCWELGKVRAGPESLCITGARLVLMMANLFICQTQVDVMEVFAVVIVYCKAPIETKIPLLFDLFDFDHSQEISQYELVLLMLCTTRGLCKVVGFDRPGTEELEELANAAFVSIDRDHSGEISLKEFSDWALKEPNLLLYLKRFAATRLIYENQLQYDTLLKQLCSSFVQFAVQVESNERPEGAPDLSSSSTSSSSSQQAQQHQQHQQHQLACSVGTSKEVIKLHCPNTEEHEVNYLVRAMQDTMKRRSSGGGSKGDSVLPPEAAPSETEVHKDLLLGIDGSLLPQMVSMEVFCMISASYVAFIVADEDKEHLLNMQELMVLLWLIRGKEPSPQIVDSYMKSLDRDQNGMLSALEWVTFAIENDTRTGSLSFATQTQLLFTNADRNGDAMLSLQEMCMGLKPIILQSLVDEELQQSQVETGSGGGNFLTETENPLVKFLRLEKKLWEHAEPINGLISGLANELMQALDKNQSHRIEWYEFRQQLDYPEDRVRQMKSYIKDFVLQ